MIRKAFAWAFAAQLFSLVVQFGGSIFVARLLSPHEMGIFAVSIATIGVLQIITAFGIGNYLVRETSLDDGVLETAFTLNAILGVSLAIAILALSFGGGSFLGDPAVATVMRWLALVPLIGIFEFRPGAMLQRDLRFKSISLVSTAQALVSSGVTVGSAWFGASYLSPAFGGIAQATLGAVAYSVIGRHHVGLRLSTRGWRPIAAFGIRMMSIGGVSALAARVSDIILGHFLGLTALGLFGRASSLSMLIFQNVYGTATRVIFAKLSKDYRELGQLRDSYLKGMRYLMAIMGPMLLGLAVLAGPVIRLLYGEKWLEAALPLSLLMIAQFITLRYAMNWELFVIKNELKVQTRIEIARSVLSVVTRTIGSFFSIAAAAAAAIVDGAFAIALYGRQINRLIDATEREMTRLALEAIALAVAGIAPAFALMLWTGWDPRTPLPWVAASIVLGALCWFALLVRLRHPLIDEMKMALARFRSPRLSNIDGAA